MSTNEVGERGDAAGDEIPLQQKRPFGSNLRRSHVAFVPASTGPLTTTDKVASAKPTRSIADMYLSLVLPNHSPAGTAKMPDENNVEPMICEVCRLPVKGDVNSTPRIHEASIAHQVCLAHSHPPSALNRSRMGLQVLQTQGWDPDARTGLGAQGQGMHYPIKATPKDDTLGIGVKVPKHLPPKKEKPAKMDAGKVRKAAAEDRKRNERLRQQLFSSSDVDKYLGN
ncbi:G-patch domain-containing protein [Microdochium nivale]|nr:G-patch domain-containing protein [Microdochium nivale]